MKRAVLTAALLALGIGAATADVIEDRKALMKGMGKEAGAGAAMVKGEAPFDLAKAKAIFAAFEAGAAKSVTQFPDTSKTGGDTAALPKIWETKADFDAKFAKLGADSKAVAASVTDIESFKTAFGGVTKNCGGCHSDYRAKK